MLALHCIVQFKLLILFNELSGYKNRNLTQKYAISRMGACIKL